MLRDTVVQKLLPHAFAKRTGVPVWIDPEHGWLVIGSTSSTVTDLITGALVQAAGIIEPGEFEIEWPDVAAPSESEKVELLKAYTAAMREAFAAGVQGLFEADELRRVVGFEPLQNDVIPTEGGVPNDA